MLGAGLAQVVRRHVQAGNRVDRQPDEVAEGGRGQSRRLPPRSSGPRASIGGVDRAGDRGVLLRVQRHRLDALPVARPLRPAPRDGRPSLLAQPMASRQDLAVAALVALRRADVADPAVPVIMVVPTHEARRARPSFVRAREAALGLLGAVLRRVEQALHEGAVVARARVRRIQAQPVQQRQRRRRLDRGTVVPARAAGSVGQPKECAATDRCGSDSTIRLFGCVGCRYSTSLRYRYGSR
jgi:hypothetical protein